LVTAPAPPSLRDRLHAIVADTPRVRPQAPPLAPEPPPIAQIFRGDWHETQHGPVFVRDEWFPLDHMHGALPLASALDAAPAALRMLLGAEAAPDPNRLAFFDIETTGLAGGTGTYVVIAGLGTYEQESPGEPPAFRMRQYFLADIAHEQAMLAMLAADTARFDGLVTYNGRTFDVPFVETRMTMARLPSPYGRLAHFDLLHPVRRLYKHRMPGCRLAEAERRLLKFERPDDLPGWLIPQLYFDYLRAGRASPLRGAFRHNAEDVLSLVGILASLAALLSSDDIDPDDAVAVARWHERLGDSHRASGLYRNALPWLEGGDDWPWAATRHAALCKRQHARAEAEALWRVLWSQGDPAAGLELAKHHEHHTRDLSAAEEVTRALLIRAPAADQIALNHRLARIRSKSARTKAALPTS
jgi:uncharacterized protein YprB with RNaseH-like and TPR domain